MLAVPWNDCFVNGGLMGLEKRGTRFKSLNGAASGEIAELQCVSNEVEDTCLSPPLLCSLVGIQRIHGSLRGPKCPV